jgi:nucleoside-diphosphate-sugar epimerase
MSRSSVPVRRVLVTGAGGFVGRQCLPRLAARGFEVHAVTRRETPFPIEGRWHNANLLVASDTERVIAEVAPEFLLHLAWYAVPGLFWKAPENLEWVEASLRLFRLFRNHGGGRLVATGSCAEYDLSDGLCSEKTTPLAPATFYGACKKSACELLDAYAQQTGLSVAWARVFFLYGPHEDPGRFVPSVISALLDGRPARCTHGRQIRDFLHVSDLADALVTLLESDLSGPINLGSGEGVALQDVVDSIVGRLQRPELVQMGALSTDATEPARIVADATRLKSELGWRPTYTLESGLSQTIDWWQEQACR